MQGHDWRREHKAKEPAGEQRRARPSAWARWVARGLLAVVLGGGLAVGPGVGQAEENKPPEAKLKLRKRKAEPYWVEIDASRSRDKDGGIEHYRFWVTEEESGVVVREPLLTGESHHGYALGPGKYRFYMEVEDNEGATDTTSNHLRIKDDVWVSASGAVCSNRDGQRVTCVLPAKRPKPQVQGMVGLTAASETLSEDANTIDLEELMDTAGVTDSTVMWIEAWGANGGTGSGDTDLVSTHHGGDAGQGGQAVTVTTLADFKAQFGTSTIYYYLGDNGHHSNQGSGDGGASSVVLTVEPTEQTLSLGEVVLIAGGGGGGGLASGAAGKDGGDGACAIAVVGQAVSAKGEDGLGEDGGGGGNGDTGGTKGDTRSGAQDGTGGIGGTGGFGSVSRRGWSNGSPDFNGNGGGGDSRPDDSPDGGGGGGGGYGGGGGGGVNSNSTNTRGGGGGGGSFAAKSTQSDTSAPTSCSDSSSADGVVKVIFNLDPS